MDSCDFTLLSSFRIRSVWTDHSHMQCSFIRNDPKRIYFFYTRMHSSRMRTSRSLTASRSIGGGVRTRGRMRARGHVWHTLVKTLPSRNYCCGKVISSQSVRSCIKLLTRTYSVATTLSQSQFEGRITFACVECGLTLPKFILVEGGSHPGKTSTHFPSVAARWKRNSCLATLQTQGQFANSISNE